MTGRSEVMGEFPLQGWLRGSRLARYQHDGLVCGWPRAPMDSLKWRQLSLACPMNATWGLLRAQCILRLLQGVGPPSHDAVPESFRSAAAR